MRINFNKGQGLSSKPQSIQENIFLFVDEIFFEGLQLSFFLPPQQTPPYLHRKVIPHRNVWFSSCLSAEYCLGVPEVDPNKKPRKNFFVKNDHAQYGKSCWLYIDSYLFIVCLFVYYIYLILYGLKYFFFQSIVFFQDFFSKPFLSKPPKKEEKKKLIIINLNSQLRKYLL